MNPASESLKKLQVQFLTSAARWANYGTEIEPVTVDLPNLVCLLQSVGYNLRSIESIKSDELSLLRSGEKGTRVVITCGHSGQMCTLELPEDAEQCKCLVKADHSQDSFWEVTATNASSKNASLIETGSDTVPAISKELNILIKNMLIFLTHMIQGTLEEVEESLSKSTSSLHSNTSKGATSSPKKDAKRLSGFIKDMVNPPIIISSPKGKDSPARYRSLDTLTKIPDEIIPPPGLLTPKRQRKSREDITQSSPALNLCKHEFTNSTGSTIADTNNEKVIQLLNQAINLLQISKSQNVSPATPSKQTTFVTEKPLLANELIKQERYLAARRKTQVIKPPSATSEGSATSKAASRVVPKTLPGKLAVKAKVTKGTEPKSVEDKTRNIITKPRKSINLYAHAKSTIPKPSPAGSFVSKKV